MHQPVMLNEVLSWLNPHKTGVYLDGTLGNGGYALELMRRLDGNGKIIGIDLDNDALVRAKTRLQKWESSCCFCHGNFARMKAIARKCGYARVDGIILDLGVSSEQLDCSERGFSFQEAGPLDMRMNQSEDQAMLKDILADADLPTLKNWLKEYGDERQAERIANLMLKARDEGRLETTADLAGIVSSVGYTGRRHPATQVFQALRIVVNRELQNLETGLQEALELLRPGGRLVVLAYHSLEDRIVKQTARRHTLRKESLAEGGWRTVGEKPLVKA